MAPIQGLGWLPQSSTDFFYPSFGLSSLEKWGPTPFRFEIAWLYHLFLKKIENWWGSLVVDGWPIFSFMKKLKVLKVILKSRNKETFGNIFSQKQVLIDKINSFDSLEGSSCFNEKNTAERELCRGALLDLIVKEQILDSEIKASLA